MEGVGINVELQDLSASAGAGLLSIPGTADHAFGLVWWPTLASPYDYMWSIFATGAQGSAAYNWGYYSIPKREELLNKAPADPDNAKRTQRYGEPQKTLAEVSPALSALDTNYRLRRRS